MKIYFILLVEIKWQKLFYVSHRKSKINHRESLEFNDRRTVQVDRVYAWQVHHSYYAASIPRLDLRPIKT